MSLGDAIVAATAGNVVGDTVTYLVGRYLLEKLLATKLGKKVVKPGLRRWGQELVRRHGVRAIFLGRFLIALRGPVYLAIGASKFSFGRFELINSAVAVVALVRSVNLY